MRELLRFLLVGFVAGWIANILLRGRIFARGCLGHTIVGMIGALMGGYLLQLLGFGGIAPVVSATIGAILLLAFLRMLRNM